MLISRVFALVALAACATVASADVSASAEAQVILVSQTNPDAHFKTIVEAVASIQEDATSVEIHVEAGVYLGVVNVKRSGPLTIRAVGEVTITQTSSSTTSSGQQNQLVQQTTSSFYASTVTVSGCTDFKMYGCVVENLQSSPSIAPAIFIGTGTASLYDVSLHAQQQTIFVGATARVYARGCTVRGASDFVAGSGTIYVEGSTLHSTGSGSIVAWRAAVAATAQVQAGVQKAKKGCWVVSSKVRGDTAASVTLARPMVEGVAVDLQTIVRAAATTVIYVGSDLGPCVKPQGWSGVQLSVDAAAKIRSSLAPITPSLSSGAHSVSQLITQQAKPNFVEAGCTGAGAANGKQRQVGLAVGLTAAVKVAASASTVFGGDTGFIDFGVHL